MCQKLLGWMTVVAKEVECFECIYQKIEGFPFLELLEKLMEEIASLVSVAVTLMWI